MPNFLDMRRGETRGGGKEGKGRAEGKVIRPPSERDVRHAHADVRTRRMFLDMRPPHPA